MSGVDEIARLARKISPTMMVPMGNYPSHPNPDEKVVLLLAGVVGSGSGGDDVANFIAAVQLVAAQVRSYYPPTGGGTPRMPVTAAQLARELSLPLAADPNCINRLMALLKAEEVVLPDGQQLYVPWQARRFHGIQNLADYRRVKARTPAAGAGVVAGPAAGLASGQVAEVPNGGIQWWQRLTPAEKVGVVAGAATIIGAAGTLISLVIH
jgi:hypothetical protein